MEPGTVWIQEFFLLSCASSRYKQHTSRYPLLHLQKYFRHPVPMLASLIYSQPPVPPDGHTVTHLILQCCQGTSKKSRKKKCFFTCSKIIQDKSIDLATPPLNSSSAATTQQQAGLLTRNECNSEAGNTYTLFKCE